MFLAPARNRLNVVDLIGRVNFLIPSSSNGDRDGDIRERVREREREKGAGIENTVESGGTPARLYARALLRPYIISRRYKCPYVCKIPSSGRVEP